MTLGLLFWILFIVAIIIGYREGSKINILLAALLFVLGWAVFGFIIKG